MNKRKYIEFREKLSSKDCSLGAWITLSEPKIAEIFGGCGFAWVLVDLEHSGISIAVAEQHLRILAKFDTISLCRPTGRSIDQMRRLLDAGADGFILPMVNSIDDLEPAILASRFPPEGQRGMGLHSANGFGLHFEEYLTQQLHKPILIAQIENIEGVNNIDSIAASAEVDGIFLGPYDLSLSLGSPGDFSSKEFSDSVRRVKEVCLKYQKPIGIHSISTDITDTRKLVDQNYHFMACSLDTKILLDVGLKFLTDLSGT